MKIAEAMTRIKTLRKEYNDVKVTVYSEGNEALKPKPLLHAIETKSAILQEILRLRSLIAKTNVNTPVYFNGATYSLSYALNLLDSMREELTLLENSVLPSLRGAPPTRHVMSRENYQEISYKPNFTEEEIFTIQNRDVKLEADIATLTSVINHANWNTELITT